MSGLQVCKILLVSDECLRMCPVVIVRSAVRRGAGPRAKLRGGLRGWGQKCERSWPQAPKTQAPLFLPADPPRALSRVHPPRCRNPGCPAHWDPTPSRPPALFLSWESDRAPGPSPRLCCGVRAPSLVASVRALPAGRHGRLGRPGDSGTGAWAGGQVPGARHVPRRGGWILIASLPLL